MTLKLLAFLGFVAIATVGAIQTGQIAYSVPVALEAESIGYEASSAYNEYSAEAEQSHQPVYAQPTAYAQSEYHAAPATVVRAQRVLTKIPDEYDPHPQYKFGYAVQDSLSGDSKSQVETRDGDLVQGEYSLIDADGYKRTVQYTSHPKHGFNAVVHREPIDVSVKADPVVAVAKESYGAPIVTYGH